MAQGSLGIMGKTGQIYKGLDCTITNMEWRDLFVFHKVDILASRFSDHAPVMLTFQKKFPTYS